MGKAKKASSEFMYAVVVDEDNCDTLMFKTEKEAERCAESAVSAGAEKGVIYKAFKKVTKKLIIENI